MRHRVRIGLVAFIVASSAGAAPAQDVPAVIKQRQALMKAQAEGLKVIQNYVNGDTNRGTALAKVNELLSLPPKIADLFPPGTSIAEFPQATHAKPEIWQQWDRFKDVPGALQRAERRLADAIGGGSKQDVLDQLDAVGRNGCGACHTSFRSPLKD